MIELFAADARDSARNADDRRILRHLAQHNGVCRNARVVADLERSEHLRARTDHDVVSKRRVAFSDVLAGAAEGHALI